jgi:hypothetical protein
MNLYNQELLENISVFLENIKLAKQEHASEMPLGDVECVLHLGRNDEDTAYECYYYLVDHENRILFWMNNFTADEMIGEIDGVTDARHISTSFPPHLTLGSHMYRVRTGEQLLVGFLGTRAGHSSYIIGCTGSSFLVLEKYQIL